MAGTAGRERTAAAGATSAAAARDSALARSLLNGTRSPDAAARIAVDEALGRNSTDRNLHAAAMLLSFAAGDGDLALHRSSAKRWVLGLDRLIDRGHLDAAAYAAPRLLAALPRIPYLVSMTVALRRLPPPVGDGRSPFRDDRTSDVQVVPLPGAQTLVLAFCGASNKLGLSLNLMDRWLARHDSHLVYLRDRQRVGYTRGIPSLGPDLAATVEALAALARDLGARRIVCVGTSAGAAGALRYAIPLRAQRVLALAPITGGPEYAELVAPQLVPGQENPWQDLVPLYREDTGVEVLALYGEQHDGDRQQTLRLVGLPNVTVEGIADWDSHHLIGALLRNNQLQGVLRWLTSPDRIHHTPKGRVPALSQP